MLEKEAMKMEEKRKSENLQKVPNQSKCQEDPYGGWGFGKIE